jgi:dienelactone hydrolase
MPLAAEHVYASSPGPKAVAVADELILPRGRAGRDLAVRVHHPLGLGPWPVLVFSHGFGGSKDMYSDLVRGWAHHGYAVVQPTHADAGHAGPFEGLAPEARERALRALREAAREPERAVDLERELETRFGIRRSGWAPEHHTPAAYRRRARDLSAVVDRLDELAAQLPHLDAGLDAKRVGVGGHSLGAYVCQLLGGVQPVWAGEGRVSLADPRVRAVAVLSGSGRSVRDDDGELDDKGLDDEAWASVCRPLLNVTGSRDSGRSGGADWKRQPYELAPPAERYQAFFARGDHGLGGLAGDDPVLGPPLRDDPGLREAIAQLTLAFWDAHVRGLERAQSWLTSGAPAALAGPDLEFSFK